MHACLYESHDFTCKSCVSHWCLQTTFYEHANTNNDIFKKLKIPCIITTHKHFSIKLLRPMRKPKLKRTNSEHLFAIIKFDNILTEVVFRNCVQSRRGSEGGKKNSVQTSNICFTNTPWHAITNSLQIYKKKHTFCMDIFTRNKGIFFNRNTCMN